MKKNDNNIRPRTVDDALADVISKLIKMPSGVCKLEYLQKVEDFIDALHREYAEKQRQSPDISEKI